MPARPRARLDLELVRRGLVETRAQAHQLVEAGRVSIDGAPASKPATLVAVTSAIALTATGNQWASRGGHKLAGALDTLGVNVAGRLSLDAGASTGGFTDVLLQAGAARVVAVDVGYGQLAWRLRQDPRVVVRDRCNVRSMRAEDLPLPPPELVVADLSFISLRLVLPALRACAEPAADHLLLVKPQFEAGPDLVGRGGVVRDPEVWRAALAGVVETAVGLGLGLVGAVVSELPGPAGNVEFFVQLAHGGMGGPDILDGAVDAGRRLASGA